MKFTKKLYDLNDSDELVAYPDKDVELALQDDFIIYTTDYGRLTNSRRYLFKILPNDDPLYDDLRLYNPSGGIVCIFKRPSVDRDVDFPWELDDTFSLFYATTFTLYAHVQVLSITHEYNRGVGYVFLTITT